VDAVLTTLIGAAPQLGGAGVLLLIIGLLLRREAQDRADYRAELARLNAAHDDELHELRVEIKGLREQVAELHTKLDAERERRRAAEDNPMGRHRQEWAT
jgi:predicted  nucleic acid-binding Zn-ribbon protein